MGTQQCVFWENFIYALVPLVVRFPYRFVNLREFAQLFQIIIHLLIADNRQYHVVLKLDILVFFKYGFAVIIQFDDQIVGSFYRGYFNMVGFDITSF